MANQIVWCDIPVTNLERAVQFYAAVLGQDIKAEEMGGMRMGILPHSDGQVGGCLVLSAGEKPANQGVMIYLNANGRLDHAIAAVESHGGKVQEPKHAIGPYGFRAIVIDSEGNRIALHSE